MQTYNSFQLLYMLTLINTANKTIGITLALTHYKQKKLFLSLKN